MKRFEAHRLHSLDALKVKPPPSVKGLSAHIVATADVFNAHASRALAQDFLSEFVCDFHLIYINLDLLTLFST